jgi:TRAP-type C4-dicarboxylate transport system substrate-binding protein
VTRPLTLIAFTAAIALVTNGCASGTKSGGAATHEISIVMQTPDGPGEPDAGYFIAQVEKLTHGAVQIAQGTDYTSADPNNEARLVRALRSGKVQMGYIPSRAWERASPITAFRALQAPLLVDSYRLLRRITTDSIGKGMLASLSRIGVLGLGLVPDELRRAFGRRPLASAAAFRGARIRVVASPTGVHALRSIGAVPLTSYTSSQLGQALRRGRIDGAELSTIAIRDNHYLPDARYLTANLALFAKTQTIVIRKSVFDRLSAADQAALRKAAIAAVAHADPAKQEEADARQLCAAGLRLVAATNADLASLRHEASAVYPVLERDPATRREMRAIERLKAELGTGTSALGPCRRETSPSGPSTEKLAGKYAMAATRAEVAAFPGSVANDNWGSFRLVLQGHRFRLSDRRPGGPSIVGPPHGFSAGTYTVNGDRITFTVQSFGGDFPLGRTGDQSIVCRWSLYRGELTFRRLGSKAQLAATERGFDAYGPPFLFANPWRLAT